MTDSDASDKLYLAILDSQHLLDESGALAEHHRRDLDAAQRTEEPHLEGRVTASSTGSPEERAAAIGGRWAVLVASIGAVALLGSAYLNLLKTDTPVTPTPPAVAVLDCPQKQRQALELQRDYPGRDQTYSGPLEDQCHLNELLKIPSSNQGGSSGSVNPSPP